MDSCLLQDCVSQVRLLCGAGNMVTIPIDKAIIDHAVWLVDHVNYGQRGDADGDKKQQVRVMIGQCVVMDMLGFELPQITQGHDGGVDFVYDGLKVDVKTMGRQCDPKPNYVNNLIGLQSHFDVDAYVFCSINRKNITITICGWILKGEFLKLAEFTPKNEYRYREDGTKFQTKADLYELANDMLNDVNSIDDLKRGLKNARHDR